MNEDITVILKNNEVIAANMRQIGTVMQAVAETITKLQEDLRQLKAQVAQLEKVTPMQAREINRALQERARVLSIEYCTGLSQPVCTAIRRALRLETGCRSVKDIARCDYQVAMEIVETWEEPEVLRKIADK